MCWSAIQLKPTSTTHLNMEAIKLSPKTATRDSFRQVLSLPLECPPPVAMASSISKSGLLQCLTKKERLFIKPIVRVINSWFRGALLLF
jgi:hypothetical protein